ncbi:hypothetical protein BD309DRAFT_413386 [Dichomitus squalens]|nr:hypothetical protein BD309DRAFT_413386 [Dichomitus squalens]
MEHHRWKRIGDRRGTRSAPAPWRLDVSGVLLRLSRLTYKREWGGGAWNEANQETLRRRERTHGHSLTSRGRTVCPTSTLDGFSAEKVPNSVDLPHPTFVIETEVKSVF